MTWRAAYDRGSQRKSGQLSQGSGTTPTVLPGGLVAITDNADPRMHVQFYDTSSGDLVCQQAVFGDDESATESSLVSVATGVVVENNHGYNSPLSTVLGRTTDAGVARVNVRVASPGLGTEGPLLAGVDLRPGRPELGADGLARQRAALRLHQAAQLVGRRRVVPHRDRRPERALGLLGPHRLGALLDNHRAAVTIAKDGSAYVATLGGMVRIRDRD